LLRWGSRAQIRARLVDKVWLTRPANEEKGPMGLSIFEPIGLVLLFLVAGTAFLTWRLSLEARRAQFIRHYAFPPGLFKRLQSKRQELTLKDCNLTAQALRQFFLAYLMGRRQFVSMPSQVVDDLWHEFILYTQNYQQFCRRAFGRFLHHAPAAVLRSSQRESNAGLRRVWWHVCREENLDPRHPSRLPLLFAIDSKLNIPDGFHYVANCESLRSEEQKTGKRATPIHCGGDFSSSAYDGTTAGYGSTACGSGDPGGSHHGHSSCGGGHSGCSSGHGCGGGGCGGGGGD
jgi:hypothetical protein